MAADGGPRHDRTMNPPRLQDVAARAGVSTATVSRALSGKGHVSPRARARVREAAQELGFVVSYHASSLASGRSRNIGVVLPHVDRWYFSTVLEGVAGALMEAGYDLTLYNFEGDRYRETVLTDFLLRKRLDAAVAVSLHLDPAETEQMFAAGIPLVGVGGPLVGAPTISIDDLDVGRRATQHLIGLGHRRIAHLGGAEEGSRYFPMSSDRRDGWEQAMADAGLAVEPAWSLVADYTFTDAYQQAKNLLADPADRPTAIFASSDEMAAGTILAARDLGLTVPGDLSVIGVDAHPIGEAFGLTTLDQHARQQGTRAVERLLEHLAGGSREPSNELFPAHFVARSSTGPAPASDHRP
ncbi:LacI family DNA-binding transcriptional regulator [Kocuria rosea]|uniref:LacI family DNA-binding transcriptional regulator n=1 Tax=Kocuria rosea TaxID=1275 RepID=UPI0011687733|nr:LacI family DNA-binding transcriptional regulator [Kocuria rosea]TQN38554.1 LacI family transcriptional regulator [Kocuria rosea]